MPLNSISKQYFESKFVSIAQDLSFLKEFKSKEDTLKSLQYKINSLQIDLSNKEVAEKLMRD